MTPPDLPAMPGPPPWTMALGEGRRSWRVAAGWADVFADLPMESGPRMRRHLFRAPEGAVLCGVPVEGGRSLVTVAGPEGRLEPAEPVEAASLQAWVSGLTEAAAGPHRAWAAHILSPGWLRIGPGQRATAPPNFMLWVSREDEGEALLHGRSPMPLGDAWPLVAPGYIEAGVDGCMLRAEIVPARLDAEVLAAFGQASLACVARHVAADQAARGRQARAGEALGEAAMHGALGRLAGQAGGAAAGLEPRVGDDPLRAAIAACCAAAGHAMPVPEVGSILAGADDPLERRLPRMLAAARAEARPVGLSPGWWRLDGMPMLGLHGPERQPVALLPGPRSGRWRAVGVGIAATVDARFAEALAAEAWQIYPALPPTPLRVRDVIFWAVRGLGGDLRRIAGMGLLAALLGLTLPAMTGLLFESVVPYGDARGLAQVAFGLLVAALGAAAFALVQSLSVLRLEARLDGRMQAALMQRLLRLPARFFRSYTVGELADRALGVQESREMLTASTFSALLGAVFGTVSLGLMAYHDWRLALLGTLLVVVLAVVLGWLALLQLRAERLRARESAKVEGFVLQLIGAIGKLRAAAAESRTMAEWARRNLPLRRAAFSAERYAAIRTTAAMVLPSLALVCIFAATVALAERDARLALVEALTAEPTEEPRLAMSAASFMAFLAAFGGLMAAMTSAATALTRALAALPMLERLRPLLAAVPESPAAAEPPPPLQGAIELRRVRFRYSDGAPEVLRDLSFAIKPGEYVALVGRSGSGKSTVLRLILGFERPEQGDVWFDGRSTERLDLSSLRQSIGVVLQNGRIGQGSLFEAIVGGVPAGLDDAWSAARLAGLAPDIEAMPMGMRTLLPDGAGSLSAGQRQRVLLARALVRQPRILVLDEATSALDNRTQAIVTDTLAALPITRVVVAHRFSTVRAVDRVLVLDEGRLVEEGPPRALLAAGGHFAALARRQML